MDSEGAESKFSNCKIEWTKFDSSDLSSATFKKTYLDSVHFRLCDLRKSLGVEVVVSNCIIKNSIEQSSSGLLPPDWLKS